MFCNIGKLLVISMKKKYTCFELMTMSVDISDHRAQQNLRNDFVLINYNICFMINSVWNKLAIRITTNKQPIMSSAFPNKQHTYSTSIHHLAVIQLNVRLKVTTTIKCNCCWNAIAVAAALWWWTVTKCLSLAPSDTITNESEQWCPHRKHEIIRAYQLN